MLDLGVAERRESALEPAPDLGVHAHAVPVLGAVPADPIVAVLLVDAGGTVGPGEVDQVYVLVPRPDVLELHPGGPVKLDGVGHILPPLPYQLDPQPRLLPHLADRRFVGELVSFYVATRRKPDAKLAVEMQEHLALPHH